MKFVGQHLIIAITLCLTAGLSLQAQRTAIVLDNPSFEDMPRHSYTPRFWTNCGFASESPPDVQPEFTFQVSKKAVDGNTYLGMVVRDNDTWESVGQLMSQPFQENTCYSFSIKLSRSLSYISQSRELGQPANYITPVKLRIWGGFGMCDKRFLLDESQLVRNTDWKLYAFKFEPDAAYTHIILETFYQTPTLFPYNGNLLLDNCSAIDVIPCDTKMIEGPQDFIQEPLAINTPSIPSPYVTPVTQPKVVITPKGAPEGEATLGGKKREDIEIGETILLESLQFEADSFNVVQSSIIALEELYRFMATNTDVNIEVRGHTNGMASAEYGLELSEARAKSVADYLVHQGISRNRIIYKGYGKEKPIDTNENAAGRKRNQRVEIKIL